MTAREQLEKTVRDMKVFASQCDAKAGGPAPSDIRKLNEMGEQIGALVQLVNGQKAVDALAGPAPDSPFAGLGDNAGMPFDGKAMTGAAGTLGAPPMAFSEESLEELHKGVLDRRVTVKDAMTVTEFPMSGIGNYNFSVFPFLRDRARILDLIPTIPTQAPFEYYFRGTTAASAADTVAPGGDKPYSEPAWTQATATVRKIAHYSRVNDEVIADFRGFLDVIGREMIAGLIDAENAQLLSGSGVAPDIEGLLINTDIQTTGSAGTDLDAVATAANLIRLNAFVEPDTVVMHPNDWASTGFLLAKDSAGQYLIGNPLAAGPPSLWGMRVVVTARMTENTVLVANLKEAARVFVRQTPTLEVQPGGGTAEFIANQTLIRAEERLALAIVRPKAICTVTAV